MDNQKSGVTETVSVAEAIALLPRPLLLGLDVDGTLAPIDPDPAAARVPRATEALVHRLAQTPGIEVALITGRDDAGLARMIRTDGLHRAVEHGLHVVHANGRVLREAPPEQSSELQEFRVWADTEFEHDSLVLVEHKPRSCGVHVRLLDEVDRTRSELVLQDARTEATRLGLLGREGKRMFEAETVSGDKGSALTLLCEQLEVSSTAYFGDDVTDGPALEYAVRHGGVGVFVRSEEKPHSPVEGALVLDGTAPVADVLSRLANRAIE